MAKGKIYIGTSGWNYKHWSGNFYPEDLKQKDWLKFYSDKLKTVEINNSFYHLPAIKTFRDWNVITPKNFTFSVKGNRYITHMKKLRDPKQSCKKLFSHAKHLNEKLGPFLFQLPPGWKFNKKRLEVFLKALPGEYRYTFEFRDKTWWNDDVLELLKNFNIAFCIYQLAGELSPEEVTADFIYIRLHGPAGKYQGNYSKKILSRWAVTASSSQSKNLDVYIYFDNDQNGYAVRNAQELQKMLEV
ncbi:MAG TPA: DUF72 domain-containing protein [Ignavibacteriaceae bacterium]|nr:DUF72 domain-containing protein [Ignavibacteriaceae bacterium]